MLVSGSVDTCIATYRDTYINTKLQSLKIHLSQASVMKIYAERFEVNPSNFKLYDIDRWHLEAKITNRIGKSSGDGLAYD